MCILNGIKYIKTHIYFILCWLCAFCCVKITVKLIIQQCSCKILWQKMWKLLGKCSPCGRLGSSWFFCWFSKLLINTRVFLGIFLNFLFTEFSLKSTPKRLYLYVKFFSIFFYYQKVDCLLGFGWERVLQSEQEGTIYLLDLVKKF